MTCASTSRRDRVPPPARALARYHYAAWGVTLHSSVALCGLPPGPPAPGRPALTLTLSASPPGSDALVPWHSPHPGQRYRLWRTPEGLLRVHSAAVGQPPLCATIDNGGARVQLAWGAPPPTSLDATTTWRLGTQVLAVALRAAGAVVLHANAIVLGGVAWLLLGVSRAGKTTLAGTLAAHGATLLADDTVVVALAHHGPVLAHPGLALSPHPPWPHGPVPLAGVLLLRRDPAQRALGIGAVRGAPALAALMQRARFPVLRTRAQATEDARVLGALAHHGHVLALTLPDDLAALPAASQALLAALRAVL